MAETKDWQELTKLTQGASLVVERVRMGDIALEGAFELPQLARLSMEDQIFVAAFLKSHGSIKEMEQVFGVSYQDFRIIASIAAAVALGPVPGAGGWGAFAQAAEAGFVSGAIAKIGRAHV